MKLINNIFIAFFIMFLVSQRGFSKQLNSANSSSKGISDSSYFKNYDSKIYNTKNTLNIADNTINNPESEFEKTRKALEETQKILEETKKQLELINSPTDAKNNHLNVNTDKYFESFDSQPDKYDTSIEPKVQNPDGTPQEDITGVSDITGIPKTREKEDLVPKQNPEELNKNELQEKKPSVNNTETIKAHVAKTDTLLQKKSYEIELLLRDDEKEMLNDLRVLWQSAVEKSTTIRLAIQKLSNPNESDKQKQGTVQKVLTPLAGLAPLALMGSTTPAQASGAVLGGGLLGTLTSDVDQRFNQEFVKVSDYDLIMLAKKIDELQENLVNAYYNYRNALTNFEHTKKAVLTSKEHYEHYKNSTNIGASTASDAFYREALQAQVSSEQEFLLARAALEQYASNEAIVFIEDLKKNPELLKKFEQEMQQISDQMKKQEEDKALNTKDTKIQKDNKSKTDKNNNNQKAVKD